MNPLYGAIRLLLLIIFKFFFRLKVIGNENVPEKGGVIVATNHTSHLDPLVISCAIKKRQPIYMAKSELFNIPVVGIFVKTFSFPVDRGKPKPSTIKETVRRIKSGELIVMFPEGGRSKGGDLLEAKRGIGMIAALAKAVIVPAFIAGTDRVLPSGAKFIKLSKISVIFGNAIEITEKDTGRDFQEKIGNDIMREIRSLKFKVQS